MAKKQNTYTAFIGGMKFRLHSEVFDNKVCDTQIKLLEGDTLCNIAGDQINNFITEFKELINKYEI